MGINRIAFPLNDVLLARFSCNFYPGILEMCKKVTARMETRGNRDEDGETQTQSHQVRALNDIKRSQ